MIDICCLGCKRSGVQISPARPQFLIDLPPVVLQIFLLEYNWRPRLISAKTPQRSLQFCSALPSSKKTRHSRHLNPKLLKEIESCMSGRENFSTDYPIFRAQKPDIFNGTGGEVRQIAAPSVSQIGKQLKQN